MPIQFTDVALQGNETINKYETTDDLGKAYVELSGKVSTGSLDLLPEEFRKDPAITRYKSVSELAKGLVETQKMVGAIEKAPEKPELYRLTAMTGLHANVKSEGIMKSLLPILHLAGLGNKQADIVQQGLLTALSNIAGQQEITKKENTSKNETSLRGEWGAEYDARIDRMQKTWELAGGKGKVTESPLENIKAMSKLVSFLSEDSLKSLGAESTPSIATAAQAQAEIDKYTKEITASAGGHDFYKTGTKGDEARKKLDDLFKLLAQK